MAKRKKTREQKMIADMRHQVYSLDNISSSLLVKKKPTVINLNTQISTVSYLKHDILKTFYLTGAILFSQILLLILLKNHILKIPFVSY